MISKFREIDRTVAITIDSEFKSILPADSLSRFIVDIVDSLDTSTLEEKYSIRGNKAYPPKMMLSLLFYSYSTGTFSSRKIERSTFEYIPAMFITHGVRPDHSVISRFRQDFINYLPDVFKEILEIAFEMGVFKLGDIALDGTKIKANASKHKAMSYAYATKLTDQIKAEIDLLMQKAADAESKDLSGLNIPEEISRREERLKAIKAVKTEIESRRKEVYKQEKDEYDKKISERNKKEENTGRKLGGKKPKEPSPLPSPQDQVNFTDEESRIMPISGGGFEQAYNAQASVDVESLLITGNHVTNHTNDKKELKPSLDKVNSLPESIGVLNKVAADSGYASVSNQGIAKKLNVDLHLPKGREKHNSFLQKHIDNQDSSDIEKERQKFYSLRKSKIEPIFGVIKSVIGFRQFSLRGIDKASKEWNLICIAYNLKRLCTLNLINT
jgi:transposase